MRNVLSLIALSVVLSGPARAYDFEPIAPIDLKEVDPSMVKDTFGAYEIVDRSGKKRCRITLLKEFGIGGYQIEVAPGCDKAFPIMGDISAWHLIEGWGIEFVDPLRKTRVRWTTPDSRYVAFGDEKDIAGMHDLIKVKDKPAARKK